MRPDLIHQQLELERARRMVEAQLVTRGISHPRVLSAMARLPREEFLPPEFRHEAYEDRAVPIGEEQTISQPFIVGYMTEQLNPTPESRVLEIGTGSGYQTAILAMLCREVYSVERIDALRAEAARRLETLGLDNVKLFLGDGTSGLPEHAPFHRIIVTAAAPRVPPTLVDQLANGGILVMPVGGDTDQLLVKIIREGNVARETPLLGCRFVKLIGRHGWQPPNARDA